MRHLQLDSLCFNLRPEENYHAGRLIPLLVTNIVALLYLVYIIGVVPRSYGAHIFRQFIIPRQIVRPRLNCSKSRVSWIYFSKKPHAAKLRFAGSSVVPTSFEVFWLLNGQFLSPPYMWPTLAFPISCRSLFHWFMHAVSPSIVLAATSSRRVGPTFWPWSGPCGGKV
jgi:hypothetical protein